MLLVVDSKRQTTWSILVLTTLGLGSFAKKFGLTPEQFGENLRDNYQRHETEQYPMEPGEAAEEHLSSMFPTTEAVLEATRHMVAMQIARDPLVRQCVRQVFRERAKINITPTKKGKKVWGVCKRCKLMLSFTLEHSEFFFVKVFAIFSQFLPCLAFFFCKFF